MEQGGVPAVASFEVGDTLKDCSRRLPSEVEITNPRHPLACPASAWPANRGRGWKAQCRYLITWWPLGDHRGRRRWRPRPGVRRGGRHRVGLLRAELAAAPSSAEPHLMVSLQPDLRGRLHRAADPPHGLAASGHARRVSDRLHRNPHPVASTRDWRPALVASEGTVRHRCLPAALPPHRCAGRRCGRVLGGPGQAGCPYRRRRQPVDGSEVHELGSDPRGRAVSACAARRSRARRGHLHRGAAARTYVPRPGSDPDASRDSRPAQSRPRRPVRDLVSPAHVHRASLSVSDIEGVAAAGKQPALALPLDAASPSPSLTKPAPIPGRTGFPPGWARKRHAGSSGGRGSSTPAPVLRSPITGQQGRVAARRREAGAGRPAGLPAGGDHGAGLAGSWPPGGVMPRTQCFAEKRGATWRGRYPGADGRLLSTSGYPTRNKALQAARAARAKIEEEAAGNAAEVERAAKGETTLAEWIAELWPAFDIELTPRANYSAPIRLFILPAFGDRSLASLRREEIDAWERALIDDRCYSVHDIRPP